MAIEINLPPEEPAEPVEVQPVPVVIPDTPAMSDADIADLARLRAEESARQDAEAAETRRIAEEAAETARIALEVAANAEAEAELAEIETPEPEPEPEPEHHEEPEDETPNVDSAWFRKLGSKS